MSQKAARREFTFGTSLWGVLWVILAMTAALALAAPGARGTPTRFAPPGWAQATPAPAASRPNCLTKALTGQATTCSPACAVASLDRHSAIIEGCADHSTLGFPWDLTGSRQFAVGPPLRPPRTVAS